MAANSATIPFLKSLSSPQATPILLDLDENTIGRDPGCKVVLDSASAAGVSRRHLAVRRVPGHNGFVVGDLGSSNGTYVNGQRVQGEQLLRSGDRLQLGQNGPIFEFVDPNEQPASPATVIDPEEAGYAVPQTVIGQAGMGAAAPPANQAYPVQSPYPLPQPLQALQAAQPPKPNKWGELAKWGLGGVGLLIALKLLFGLGNPTRESNAPPRSSPVPSASSAPTQPDAPDAPPQPTTPQVSPGTADGAIKVSSVSACRSTQDRCTADSSTFSSNDAIDITVRFEDRLPVGTVFASRVEYTPSQGKPIAADVGKKTFPNAINTFTLSLGQPRGGWPPGSYSVVISISNSSGSATANKTFLVQ